MSGEQLIGGAELGLSASERSGEGGRSCPASS